MDEGNPFPIMVNDCDLFEQDLFPNEFEYFCKHTQAFRSMWLEKTVEDKIDFIEEYFHYSQYYGYIRDFPLKMNSKKKYFNAAKEFLIENFAKAKVSAAKSIIQQIAVIASNKEKILQLGGTTKSKDPFYVKETRDTFRTFFGEPGHPDTWKKTVANMPLYTRFSGAICRVLRRWIEGFSVPPELARKTNLSRNGSTNEENLQSQTKVDRSLHKSTSETNLKSDSKHGIDSDSMSESGSVDTEKSRETEEIKVVLVQNDLVSKSLDVAEDQDIEKGSRSADVEASRTRLHHCSWCHAVEPKARLYKKCALCKGKGTRFYCSKDCQTLDWLRRHKQYHIDRSIQ